MVSHVSLAHTWIVSHVSLQCWLGHCSDPFHICHFVGKGPLAQIGIPLGQPLNKEIAGAALFLWIGFFAVAAIGAGNLGQQTGNEDVY